MLGKELLRTQDEVVDEVGSGLRLGHLGLDHQRAERLQGHIVGRGAMQALVASLDDEQVAVLHTGVKAHALIAQMLLQVLYQHIGLLGGDMSRRVVLEDIALDAHEVAAGSNLIRSEVYTDIGRLEHSPTLIYFVEVVAKDRHIGHLAAGMEAVGHGAQHTRTPHTGQAVHIRGMGILQQCLIV